MMRHLVEVSAVVERGCQVRWAKTMCEAREEQRIPLPVVHIATSPVSCSSNCSSGRRRSVFKGNGWLPAALRKKLLSANKRTMPLELVSKRNESIQYVMKKITTELGHELGRKIVSFL